MGSLFIVHAVIYAFGKLTTYRLVTVNYHFIFADVSFCCTLHESFQEELTGRTV